MKNNQMVPKRKKNTGSDHEFTEGRRICIYPALHYRISCFYGCSNAFIFRVFIHQIQYIKVTGFYRTGKLHNYVYSGSKVLESIWRDHVLCSVFGSSPASYGTSCCHAFSKKHQVVRFLQGGLLSAFHHRFQCGSCNSLEENVCQRRCY